MTNRSVSVVADFLIAVERLKLIERKAYVSDFSRRENSAEHSWHMALALIVLDREFDLKIDLHKALTMALIHDLCEIDAGDTPLFGPERPDQFLAEAKCIDRLAGFGIRFGQEIKSLWQEFEAQKSPESRWVKALDRITPFIVNLATEGRNWRELSISRSQVLQINRVVQQQAPEIFEWMRERVEECVQKGWLRDA